MQFVWQPYLNHEIEASIPEDVRVERPVWSTVAPLICFEAVEWHPADRIMRQFGLNQNPPDDHPSLLGSHNKDGRGSSGLNNWRMRHEHWVTMWEEDRHARIVHGEPIGNYYPSEAYWDWYAAFANDHLRLSPDMEEPLLQQQFPMHQQFPMGEPHPQHHPVHMLPHSEHMEQFPVQEAGPSHQQFPMYHTQQQFQQFPGLFPEPEQQQQYPVPSPQPGEGIHWDPMAETWAWKQQPPHEDATQQSHQQPLHQTQHGEFYIDPQTLQVNWIQQLPQQHVEPPPQVQESHQMTSSRMSLDSRDLRHRRRSSQSQGRRSVDSSASGRQRGFDTNFDMQVNPTATEEEVTGPNLNLTLNMSPLMVEEDVYRPEIVAAQYQWMDPHVQWPGLQEEGSSRVGEHKVTPVAEDRGEGGSEGGGGGHGGRKGKPRRNLWAKLRRWIFSPDKLSLSPFMKKMRTRRQ